MWLAYAFNYKMLTRVDKNAQYLWIILVIAAATENYDNSKNDDPGAVIVKKMAKAVVIHSMFLRSMFAIFHRSFTYYAEDNFPDTKPKNSRVLSLA